MKKKTFSTELAYFIGVILLALGGAMMNRSNFGISMVILPAYMIYSYLSMTLPGFTFGMSCYTFQGVLIILLSVGLHKFKKGYLFSFITAVLYGLLLDVCISLLGSGYLSTASRLIFYVVGMLVGALGVAFLFHTYFAPEAYELVVKEVSAAFNCPISHLKTIYDCSSLVLGFLLAGLFFSHNMFDYIKLGTVIHALLNGFFIGRADALLLNIFTFEDRLNLRHIMNE